MGHYISDCPEWKEEGAAKPNPFKGGHANHIHVEGNYNEPKRVNGTFSIKFAP
jgi:hypothetical protein